MNQEEIGKFIAMMRKEKNLTQEQLAEMLGTTQKSVSRWETGRNLPDVSLFEPLCSALDIQLSELLYAKRLTDNEKTDLGETSALSVLTTKAQLETLAIFSEILILVGIVISITLTKFLSHTSAEMFITLVSGWFVWGFGLFLKVMIRKAITKLDKA